MKQIILISGVSGGGKDTIYNIIKEKYNGVLVKTTTTKQKRHNENEKYNHVSKKYFEDTSLFLEYREVYSDVFYGVTIEEFEKAYYSQKNPFIIMDINGCINMEKVIREKYRSNVHILFLHTNKITIKQRLLDRNSDSVESIEKRMNTYDDEVKIASNNENVTLINSWDITQTKLNICSYLDKYIKKPIVVNLFGGPGVGKSTTAARIFSELKMKKYECELVREYAKDLTWQMDFNTLSNQLKVFSDQHHRMHPLNTQVDVIVTDSPLLFTLIYTDKYDEMLFEKIVLNYMNQYNNINIVLNRTKEYNPNGRNQTEKEAIDIDKRIKKLLDRHQLSYHNFNYPIDDNLHEIVELINKELELYN